MISYCRHLAQAPNSLDISHAGNGILVEDESRFGTAERRRCKLRGEEESGNVFHAMIIPHSAGKELREITFAISRTYAMNVNSPLIGPPACTAERHEKV